MISELSKMHPAAQVGVFLLIGIAATKIEQKTKNKVVFSNVHNILDGAVDAIVGVLPEVKK